MKTLQSIQKFFHVFQILTKIAYVFSIVGAVFCAVGALCAFSWYTGGQVFSLFGEPVTIFSSGEGMNQMLAVLLSDLVMLITEAILLFFANRYCKTELAEGTPFTENGANLLKKLGIRCIYVPIVAIVISAVVTAVLDTPDVDGGIVSNLPGIGVGLILILASFIFRYGAELEGKANARLADSGESGLDS